MMVNRTTPIPVCKRLVFFYEFKKQTSFCVTDPFGVVYFIYRTDTHVNSEHYLSTQYYIHVEFFRLTMRGRRFF